MKIVNVLFVASLLLSTASAAQQTSAFFDVVAGNGNGVRFWQSSDYKIHMGNSAEYLYGPVTDYSIKTNMGGNAGRGWTWGVTGQTPVAAMNNAGDMQIAGKFTALGNINVGPGAKLSFNNVDAGTQAEGITWHSPSPMDYGIFRTPGAWNSPDYQQLKLNFTTGIILNPGSSYGKSFVDIQGGGLRVSSGSVGIGTYTPYSHSRLHVKSPGVTPWGLMVEANGNDKVIAVGHDGTSGFISTSYLATGSHSSLELRTSNISRISIAPAGNVGIGEANPTLGRLQVNQSSDASDKGIAILNSTGVRGMRLWTDPNNSYVYSGVTGQANLILNGTGNVGIGTTTPNQKLTVNGIIYGKQVKVDLSVPGPDYVFENDYKLPSLEEIKSYIDQHRHLPEVPSAKEMEASGINVGEMNMILLKKIEELTLYMLQQQKQLDAQQKEIQALKSQKK